MAAMATLSKEEKRLNDLKITLGSPGFKVIEKEVFQAISEMYDADIESLMKGPIKDADFVTFNDLISKRNNLAQIKGMVENLKDECSSPAKA